MNNIPFYSKLLTELSSSSNLQDLSVDEVKALLESYYNEFKETVCGTEYEINKEIYDDPLNGLVKENNDVVDYKETERRLSSYSERQFKLLKKSIKTRLSYELHNNLVSKRTHKLRPKTSLVTTEHQRIAPSSQEKREPSNKRSIPHNSPVHEALIKCGEESLSQINEAKNQDIQQLVMLFSQLDGFKYNCIACDYYDKDVEKKIVEIEKLKINLMRSVNNFYAVVQDKDRQRRCGSSVISEMHFTPRYDDKQLKTIYEYLIDNCYIEPLLFDEFSFYFSGRGHSPFCNVKWNKSTTLLSIFIATLFSGKTKADAEPEMWKKAEFIFKKKNLAQTYQQSLSGKNYEKSVQLFENILN